MKNEVYLKPNVLAEPLVCGWYAWTHLIQPATAGRNIVERHLSIMKSFVQAPQVHLAATRNPAMTGGPFISYGPERVKDIRALMDRTLVDQASLIKLAVPSRVSTICCAAKPRALARTALQPGARATARLRRAGLRPQSQPLLPPHRAASVRK